MMPISINTRGLTPMFWTPDMLNIFEHSAVRRALKAWDERIAAMPLRHPRWFELKARADREAKRARLWIDRKIEFEDALLARDRRAAARP